MINVFILAFEEVFKESIFEIELISGTKKLKKNSSDSFF